MLLSGGYLHEIFSMFRDFQIKESLGYGYGYGFWVGYHELRFKEIT